MPNDRGLVVRMEPGRAVKAAVAVAEDPPVSGDQPVAPSVVRGCHADDGGVQCACSPSERERPVAS